MNAAPDDFNMAKIDALTEFDPADHLGSNAMLVAYLREFFGEDDPAMLRAAIETAVRALARRDLEPLVFGMRGEKMTFSVGVQSFTLDYAPTEPGEFEFMADMLKKAIARAKP